VGPGGDFLSEESTVTNMRSGEWLIPNIGTHKSRETWENTGRIKVIEEARETVDALLAEHNPMPLPPEAEKELDCIEQRAKAGQPI
jgi:trimethylamine:corrinoid methyltransferase-like protein